MMHVMVSHVMMMLDSMMMVSVVVSVMSVMVSVVVSVVVVVVSVMAVMVMRRSRSRGALLLHIAEHTTCDARSLLLGLIAVQRQQATIKRTRHTVNLQRQAKI